MVQDFEDSHGAATFVDQLNGQKRARQIAELLSNLMVDRLRIIRCIPALRRTMFEHLSRDATIVRDSQRLSLNTQCRMTDQFVVAAVP